MLMPSQDWWVNQSIWGAADSQAEIDHCHASATSLYSTGVNKSTACPFCALPQARLLFRNDSSIAFRDAYPVTPGHTLVIPRRHVSSFFDTTPEERTSMLELLEAAKQQIQSEFDPAGYNIGINDGAAAGQTVGHLHIHLIPRYPGDQPDPRGGIRWVIPEKADYWTGRT
jgi:diadenosine tetraphosphate (Ap4A) HIT family hydrolase